jgi:hypothetical protein
MFAVIFEVEPAAGRQQEYLDSVVRDYGRFDRAQAPQQFPEIKR